MIRTKAQTEAKVKALATGFLLALMAAFLLLAAVPAHAATFTVNSTDDRVDNNPGDGSCFTGNLIPASGGVGFVTECTLRAVVQEANASPAADKITVPAGTYTLTIPQAFPTADANGDLDIRGELTINGAGARSTIVRGGELFDDRIFETAAGANATITGLTITGGRTSAGGGVRNEGAVLSLDEVAVRGNTATNLIGGGGVFSETNGPATLNITDSTVSGNSSSGFGGGVRLLGGTANVTNSTISGNEATSSGGGLFASESTLTDSSATMNIRNSTIADNASREPGAGIRTGGAGAAVNVRNSILHNNLVDDTFASNCDTSLGGTVNSQGNNVSSDASCGFTKPGDKQNVNSRLGPLADNGGPTDTHALLARSPAIDAGSATGCPATDQREVRRPQNGDGNSSAICDVGAFERKDLAPPTVTAAAPADARTGVRRNTNLAVTFSEQMDRTTLTRSTFKLFRVNSNGTTTQITNVTVSSTTDGLKAALNPFGTSSKLLVANTRYRAVITPGAKDRAGNGLDQNPSASGSQPMVWTFTTGGS